MATGNLRSVRNALYQNGFDPVFVTGEDHWDTLTHMVVPGVGNFSAVMQELAEHGLVERLRKFAASGRPLLGICAGMQMLAMCGEEGGQTEGLGLVDGFVERLPEDGLVLPHVGWSSVALMKPHPVLDGLKPGRDFYFVHSYAMRVTDRTQIVGETEYGSRFVSIVGKQNIIGFQFHPEKSQSNGLKLLENFGWWDGKC